MSASDTPDYWTEEQGTVFDKVKRFIASNQDGVRHPGAKSVSQEHWNTIAHNCAYIAAELMDADEVSIFEAGKLIAKSPPAIPNG
jgi:hypothetical protein